MSDAVVPRACLSRFRPDVQAGVRVSGTEMHDPERVFNTLLNIKYNEHGQGSNAGSKNAPIPMTAVRFAHRDKAVQGQVPDMSGKWG